MNLPDIICQLVRYCKGEAVIYFDASASSLLKPLGVSKAVKGCIDSCSNPGRSFYDSALAAGRIIDSARRSVSKLVSLDDSLNVAFTSGATESLNLVISNFITYKDHVITTAFEHNSVLRPLYKSGCELSILPIAVDGQLDTSGLKSLLKENTKALVCNHGSNVTGQLLDPYPLYDFCKSAGILFILDVAQTCGCTMVNANMADMLCFTGHKSLMGPQGCGGIICNASLDFPIAKTGGTGSHTFDRFQSSIMPDCFEAGTPNTPALAGLNESVSYLNSIDLESSFQKKSAMRLQLSEGLAGIKGVELYGEQLFTPDSSMCYASKNKLPVISFNLSGYSSQDLAFTLWEDYQIACRSGNHCAPLVHEHFDTKKRGMLRLSFGMLNTEEEIDRVVSAVGEIASR